MSLSRQFTGSIDRLSELYHQGGVREVARGIRDFVRFNNHRVLYHFARTRTLSAGGVAVTIRTDTPEAYTRANQHSETAVQADFVKRVGPADTVWDVGANIGSYALLAAEAGASVVAFEPGPQARAALVDNAERNDIAAQIDATPYALADYDGAGVLLPAHRTGIRELAPDGEAGDTVPVRRGDSLDVTTPDVVKIDVEGAELKVLDGMADTLSQVRLAYVEVHDDVAAPAVSERLSGAGIEVTERWGGENNEILRGEQ